VKNSFSEKYGSITCEKCLGNTITLKDSSTSYKDCLCIPGYYFNQSSIGNREDRCIKCPLGSS
jgi:hypothetical protein